MLTPATTRATRGYYRLTTTAAGDAAWGAAYSGERAWQTARLIELTEAGEWTPPQP